MGDMLPHRGRRDINGVGFAALLHPRAPRRPARRALLAPTAVLPFGCAAAREHITLHKSRVRRLHVGQKRLEIGLCVFAPLGRRDGPPLVVKRVFEAGLPAVQPHPPERRVEVHQAEESGLRVGLEDHRHLRIKGFEIVLAVSHPDRRRHAVRHAERAVGVRREDADGIDAQFSELTDRLRCRPERPVGKPAFRRSRSLQGCGKQDNTRDARCNRHEPYPPSRRL